MYPYRIAEIVNAIVPHMFNKFFLTYGATSVYHKIFKYACFLAGQRQRFVSDNSLARFCVKRNITAGQHNIILSELSEGKTANPCSKFFQMERLCQIIVCTCIQTVNLIRHFTTGRQNQHLCVTVGFSECSQNSHAVSTR